MLHSLALLLLAGCSLAQQTAKTSVAPRLQECYQDPILLNRNNLPPMTMPVLIDIIQYIEDNPDVNLDLRQLTSLLLHTYRQDGIEFHQPDIGFPSTNILPYSATHHSFHRHRLLLTRLIPNNLQSLSNSTLQSAAKCAIHHMLSTTVDNRLRNDESVCNQLSQYRASRLPRSVETVKDDFEILDESFMNMLNMKRIDEIIFLNRNKADKNGQMREVDLDDEIEFANDDGQIFERQTYSHSECPILDGVVNTIWGAVSAGNLIAGIAAGAEPQRVPISQLTKDPINENNLMVTNIYPATLAGDLAEATLIQGTERASTNIVVGAAGGWNSTQARRYHMLQSRLNIEMTDAEIRGGIDGFVLGSNLQSILNNYNSIRLSQLLDMYYSPRNGVFDETFRACNRRDLNAQNTNTETLIAETTAFATALDSNLPLRGSMMTGLESLVTTAVTNFQNYVGNNLNDVSCATSAASMLDSRSKININLVVDASWQYETIYPAISHILDSIEVGKYGSSVTLLSAFDGSVVVDQTFSLTDFHSRYTMLTHQTMLNGVNILNVLTNVRARMAEVLEWEKGQNYVGGNSSVLLFLLNSGNINNNNEVLQVARSINDTIPDMRVLFATSTNQYDAVWSLVRDMHNDIFTINLSSNGEGIESTMTQLLNRIRSTGRRIINPTCGSLWNGERSGNRHFDDYLEPNYTNFYAISPNYFYHSEETRRVRVARAAGGSGVMTVCYSRVLDQPRPNVTSILGLPEDAVTCFTLTGNGNVEIDLRNACDGYWTIGSCPPLFISVQLTTTGTSLPSICPERACRYPYNSRFQVQIEDFDCYSNARNVIASLTLVLGALLISFM